MAQNMLAETDIQVKNLTTKIVNTYSKYRRKYVLYIYFEFTCLQNVQLKLFCILYVLHFTFPPRIISSFIVRAQGS
jgi:hypothetical protein